MNRLTDDEIDNEARGHCDNASALRVSDFSAGAFYARGLYEPYLRSALAAMQREREVRAQLVEALEGAANLRLFVGNYDGKMFDKAKLFAIIDKADAALLAAKELG